MAMVKDIRENSTASNNNNEENNTKEQGETKISPNNETEQK